jgi:hypothetical protein
LQKELIGLVKGSFEFRNTGNRSRVVAEEEGSWTVGNAITKY